jgi:TonB family protein
MLQRITFAATIVAVTFGVARAQQVTTVYRPGNGVTLPKVTREVRPQYTSDAMRAGISGTVVLELTVKTDGTPDDVEVTRSLDKEHGLDEQAVNAAKQWRFEPGTKDGKPVPVRVWIEMTFTMKK